MNGFKAALVKLLLQVCALLPLSWARGLGRLAVDLYWPFGGRSRKVTERNIELAFPELASDEQARLARDSLRATGELAGEMGERITRNVRKLVRREIQRALTSQELE